MKLALIGGRGMLGSDLADAARARGHFVSILDVPECDITREDTLRPALPDAEVAINCAAYTRVDDAEHERDLCRAINADGAGNVARACAARGIYLIHISTDYVFDGEKRSAYVEEDSTRPINWYGQTKLDGERLVMESGARALIVRTQSLYGLRGRNFVKAILNQIQKGAAELRVVCDQVSSPTYTRHLAEILLDLAERRPEPGILHAAADGACSWWEFACAIVERTRPGVRVEKRVAEELKYPARRPPFSVLDTSKLRALLGRTLPHWSKGLEAYLAEEPLAAEVRAMPDHGRSL